MCPICTVTVVAGLGLSRLLGIDDLITSLWIGGLILSFSFVTINWINGKWPKIRIQRFQIPFILLIYFLVLIPLKWDGSIGVAGNSVWGIDKILLGTAVGSLVFLAGVWTDKKVRAVKGKQLFSYQKVVLPIAGLLIISLVIYYFGGYLK